MAFYTFVCCACGKKFETRCTIAQKENGEVICPHCGANELDRHFEGFAVAVKGAQSACPKSDACPAKNACACGGCAAHS